MAKKRKTSKPTRRVTPEERAAALRADIENLRDDANAWLDAANRISTERNADEELAKTFPVISPRHTANLAKTLCRLIGHGRGNRVLARYCDSHGIPYPSLELVGSAASATTTATQMISIGALPHKKGTDASLDSAVRRRCISFVEGSNSGSYTWLELIAEYANRAAVHFDEDRPVAWDIVSSYTCGHVPAIDFMIYRLTLGAIELGNAALTAAGEEPVPDTGSLTSAVGGMELTYFEVSRKR